MSGFKVQVVAPVLTWNQHCPHCETVFDSAAGIGEKVHNQEINEYPEDVKDDYLRLSNLVRDLQEDFDGRVVIQVVDPQSLVGMYKSIRHNIRDYPTFLIDGEKHVGWDKAPIKAFIQEHAGVDAERVPVPQT